MIAPWSWSPKCYPGVLSPFLWDLAQPGLKLSPIPAASSILLPYLQNPISGSIIS